jgi:hypothetical protein
MAASSSPLPHWCLPARALYFWGSLWCGPGRVVKTRVWCAARDQALRQPHAADAVPQMSPRRCLPMLGQALAPPARPCLACTPPGQHPGTHVSA